MSQLEEIKARVEKATPGPWRTWQHGGGPRNSGVETTWAHKGDEPVQISDWCFPADAELIAAAPKLLAALEAVERLTDDAVTNLAYNAGGMHLADRINAAIKEALQ